MFCNHKMHEIWTVDSQENYYNCSHQMSDFKAKMHQIRFRRPDPAGGAYSAPPDSLAGFKGPLRGREGEGKGMGKGRGMGRYGKTRVRERKGIWRREVERENVWEGREGHGMGKGKGKEEVEGKGGEGLQPPPQL